MPQNNSAFSKCEDDSEASNMQTSTSLHVMDANKRTFAYAKLFHEFEMQRRETADAMVQNMLTKMAAKRTEMMTKFWHQQDLEYERRLQERRNRELEILQEWAIGDQRAKMEQEKLDEENRIQSEHMRMLLQKQLESTKLFETLNTNHTNMCVLYQDIISLKASEDNNIFSNIYQKYEPTLSSLLSSMNFITESCKSGNITHEDVQKSTALTSKMNGLKNTISDEYYNELKLVEEAAKKKSAAKNESKIETKNENENVQIQDDNNIHEEKVSGGQTKVKFCSSNSLNLFIENKQFLEKYESSYKELLDDPSLKKFRFDCQKAVNTPVNAISSVSGTHLKDKYDKLFKLLSGEKVKVGDTLVSCALHPQGRSYCTSLLARKIVLQGEQLVSSNPEAAFPLASVTIALWAKFPDLGKLLCAYFHRDCPYLIPLMLPQCEGQSDEQYYKARGYIYNQDGSVEKQDKFLKRMSGLFRLCAAIWVTKMPYSVNSPHPQGLLHAWRWMAAFINLDPETDITATLLYEFLSVCGSDFFKCYRGQFVKVLQFLVTDYIKKIEKIDEGGPKTRLEVFLQSVIKDGSIPPPAGLLSDRVW